MKTNEIIIWIIMIAIIILLAVGMLFMLNYMEENKDRLPFNQDERCSKDFPFKTICGQGTDYENECCCNIRSLGGEVSGGCYGK